MARLSHASGLSLGPLTPADVPAAVELSTAIGWNQDEAEWRRLVELHPEGAVAARLDGRLVGTATLVRYPAVPGAPGALVAADQQPIVASTGAPALSELAWLGMVIAHPEFRGLGIGAAVTDAALRSWPAPQDGVIGLDATEFGAPIYQRRGFQAVATIDRWAGDLRPAPPGDERGVEVVRAEADGVEELIAFDRSEAGVDRAALLRHLAGEETVRLLVARSGGELLGYLALRSGRHHRHIGPLVAREPAVASRLLDAAASLTEDAPVFLDSVRGALPGSVLEGHGLQVTRTLQRMTRPAREVFTSSAVMAAYDFAWG